MAPVIGLTGGIGSGKSTVARLLGELGAEVVDADRVGHDVYEPGTEGFRRVVDCFGEEVVGTDGRIDRGRLGQIVFADPNRLRELNAIVHPLIAAEIGRRIAAHRAGPAAAPLVIEAALLVEAGWYQVVDETWLVVAAPEVVTHRLATDRNLDAAAIERRRRAQLSDAERTRHANVLIDNSGSREELAARVRTLWAQRFASDPP